jgi:hypothetical protein
MLIELAALLLSVVVLIAGARPVDEHALCVRLQPGTIAVHVFYYHTQLNIASLRRWLACR